jgi:hypothetical protein
MEVLRLCYFLTFDVDTTKELSQYGRDRRGLGLKA